MKSSLSSGTIIALLAGIAGLILPILLLPESIAPDIRIATGIFLLSAIYYMTQPVPIYATSLLVMLLSILTLTTDAPVKPDVELVEVSAVTTSEYESAWKVPIDAVNQDKMQVYQVIDGTVTPINVAVIEANDEHVTVVVNGGGDVGLSKIVENADYGQRRVGALTAKSIFATLASPIIILFLGGFMLAAGAVKYNLDTNLTRILLKPFGERPSMIIMGLMAITALLSAFMSNTATTAMMMTMIIPIVSKVDMKDQFRIATALSIPVAANIGGIATPIGTPPNAIVVAGLSQRGFDIGFSDWMILAVPVVLILLVVSWFLLQILFKTKVTEIKLNVDSTFDTSPKAILFYVIFGSTVLLWITENQHGISSSMVAFIPVTLLSLTSVLEKEDIRSLPWEVLWLVAGGIALGLVINQTGLAKMMVSMIDWNMMTALLLTIGLSLLALVMSNFLSNTVTAALLVPIGISIGINADIVGYNYMIGALSIGVAASCAMLLPISTPPNAIAISTNLLDTKDMTRFGLLIGVIAIVIITLASEFYWPLFF